MWLVGDLVNRGPRSLEVLRWARRREAELGSRFATVLGNHDVHLLTLAEGLGKPHHGRALADVLDAPDGAELAAWLRRRPLLHAEGRFVLVHAGLLAGWTAEEAAARARRAEAVLRRREGLRILLGLADAGGPEEREARETFRVTTRIRTLTRAGKLCGHTGPPEDAPEGCLPWFDLPRRATADRVVVAGHWAALGRRLRSDLVALDSGCVYGGELSAVRLEDREVWAQPMLDS